uniref:SWIB domain-containing protein n=1 Tax=Heterorhabditis bacteriophora TaxID=37862 RepID=A0A1I7W8L2_HETBA
MSGVLAQMQLGPSGSSRKQGASSWLLVHLIQLLPNGYYDRMLTDHNKQFCNMPKRYGLALKEQIVEQVPLSAVDVKLDGIIHA